MLADKKKLLMEEIEEKRSLVSKIQKEIAEKEKEVSMISQSEQMLKQTKTGSSQQEKPDSSKYDEEERAKKYYVIYNGLGRGIYEDWGKASLFITGVKNVRHKKFLSRKEAQESLNNDKEEAIKTTEATKTYLEKLQDPKKQPDRMVKLGKVLTPRTIDSILNKQELQQQKRLTKKIFDEEFQFLMKYSDEDKITSIYPVDSRVFGPKAVVLPEADPIRIFMLYQCGFVHTIYFNNLDSFQFFPDKMKRAIQVYSQRMLKSEKGIRQGFLRIGSTSPEFDNQGEVIQPAIQLCQVGASNSNYPVIGEIEESNELDAFLENYTYILQKGIKIQGRINYSAKSTVIWSQQSKPPAEQDIQILSEFLYRLIRNEFEFSEEVKKEICLKLQKDFSEDHICKLCEQLSTETEVIIEE